jgi:CheY-like chemotaxis protein
MKILIVDDIAINRFILKEIVKKLGHEYFESENGLKAYNCLIEHDIDLIFMDIEMPVMNGIETTHKIRTSLSEPKRKVLIYALTAYYPSLLNEEIDLTDFDGVISKPYSEDKIKNLLNRLLRSKS